MPNIDLRNIDEIFELKKEIRNLCDRIKYLDDEMQSVGGFSTDERVQSSPTLDNNKVIYAIDEKQLLQDRINEKQVLISRYQQELTHVINNLDNDKEKDVIRYRYLHLTEYTRIAEIMQYSESQIRRYAGKAMMKLYESQRKSKKVNES